MGTLTKNLKRELLKEGWLPQEIHQLDNAKTPSGEAQKFNINSATFSAMRRSRVRYVGDLLKVGWTRFEIKEKIKRFHQGKNIQSVWDFLKHEYIPPKRITKLSDAMLRKKSQVRRDMTRKLGYNYGRNSRRLPVMIRIPRPIRIKRRGA